MWRVFGRFLPGSRASMRAAKDAGRRVFKVTADTRMSLEEHGVVFLQIRRGAVLRANATGRRIVELLIQKQDLAEIARQMSVEYGLPFTQVEGDVRAFVGNLHANGLIAADN